MDIPFPPAGEGAEGGWGRVMADKKGCHQIGDDIDNYNEFIQLIINH